MGCTARVEMLRDVTDADRNKINAVAVAEESNGNGRVCLTWVGTTGRRRTVVASNPLQMNRFDPSTAQIVKVDLCENETVNTCVAVEAVVKAGVDLKLWKHLFVNSVDGVGEVTAVALRNARINLPDELANAHVNAVEKALADAGLRNNAQTLIDNAKWYCSSP